ncbi:hypothetical protein GWP43_00850 [Treponema vincentii]|uniref:Uncharacterized protein n=1 Tax=Treponema vincentii TaxID=69710 RepID=A0A6P1XYS4_9SPIR|nr:hypothetical protein [Treponema vincentii]QHX42239.1 hypothetical protein GWP43_00850 [Treponema vincentii]
MQEFLAYVESYYYERVGACIAYPRESLYEVQGGQIEVVKIQGGGRLSQHGKGYKSTEGMRTIGLESMKGKKG